MAYDLILSAVVGIGLSIVIIFFNTRNSAFYVEQYLKTSTSESSSDSPAKPFSKRNRSIDALEQIYGVKEADVMNDQSANHHPNDVNADQDKQEKVMDNPIDLFYFIEWIIFIAFICIVCYLVNESTGGDLARMLVGMFPREFEVLGLKEYFERIIRQPHDIVQDL
jgi:hypothetical protein